MAYFPPPQPFTSNPLRGVRAVNLTPSQVNATTTATQAFSTVTGDRYKDPFVVVGQLAFQTADGTLTQTSGIVVLGAFFDTSNNLNVIFQNTTGGALTPAAGYYWIATL